MKERIVVVGNGMVGHHFVMQLRLHAPTAQIVIVGAEPRPAYDRVHLSDVFAGQSADDLALATVDEYTAAGIETHFGHAATSLDTDRKQITLSDGRTLRYGVLVLATGSYPFVPPVPGHDHERCFVYRTIEDLERIRRAARQAGAGVVVGGGLLGLECANALKNLQLDTHVVEFAPGLMGVQLDPGGSAMLQRRIEALDVRVHTGKVTERIDAAPDGNALTLHFTDGATLATDLVVFSAGIRPHDALAAQAGLTIGPRGGIVVDEHCRSSAPDVYAVGECALYDGRIFGLVAPGYRMAEAAAGHLTGRPAPFHGADMSTKLKLLGVDVGAIGDGRGDGDDSLSYTWCDPRKSVYRRMNVSADGTTLRGAVLVGDCAGYDMLLQYYRNGMRLPDEPESLLLPAAAGAPDALDTDVLPGSAAICSCHNVVKGRIVDAIDGGCRSLAEVKSTTAAGTGCGGCTPLLQRIVDTTLEARGIAADTSLCEHFPHTRQALFHICRVERIERFAELLQRHGRGRGCDICKPAVASILASLWNDYVLSDPHAPLQDTNDRFLANMQKDGTYSVVPRVPGGEITPQKLVVLGRVAARYDLYTKITGAQRIDLLGARLEQLPAIWRDLVDAGFETGHAYGKAVRTVKSCVGSTWCRYGMQDSVAMAIRLENRYKGLRAPHKIKLAVSGCARECAEAQSKDVGVIATERGWNLYVAGNGGMRPRHAQLFATDLDDQALLRYIDRFLMFYVRTADRLQRTASWLEGLDGGLDYVRKVVIDDSLGIAVELQAQMAHVVDSYRCEWRATLEDPERLKRFRAFVNTPVADDRVVFVRERGQKRPATAAELERPAAAAVALDEAAS